MISFRCAFSAGRFGTRDDRRKIRIFGEVFAPRHLAKAPPQLLHQVPRRPEIEHDDLRLEQRGNPQRR
jgi:hypothetical protein